MRPPVLAALLLMTACVPRARYANTVTELDEARQLVMLQQVAMAQMEAEVANLESRCGRAIADGPPPTVASNHGVNALRSPEIASLYTGPQKLAMEVLNTAPAPCKRCDDKGMTAASCMVEDSSCTNMPGLVKRVAALARQGADTATMALSIAYENPWVLVPTGDSPALGPANAPVTIVMFLEVQCPYCVRGSATMDQLRDSYGDQIRVVYKHFPLAFHDQAKPAAIAMEAARRQDRFWEYRDALYARANELRGNRELVHEVAEQIGLNMTRFQRDLEDPATTARVEGDMELGASLGVTGTPAFFVNGYGMRGAQPADKFAALIDRELGQ